MGRQQFFSERAVTLYATVEQDCLTKIDIQVTDVPAISTDKYASGPINGVMPKLVDTKQPSRYTLQIEVDVNQDCNKAMLELNGFVYGILTSLTLTEKISITEKFKSCLQKYNKIGVEASKAHNQNFNTDHNSNFAF